MKLLKNMMYKLLGILTITSLLITACSVNSENTNKEETSANIDKSTGLEIEGAMDLKYAENFGVEYLKGGYKLVTDASDRKTLIIPEGKEVPENIEAEVNIINQPVEDIGIYSTIEASWFRPIKELDKIATVTFDKDSWKIEEIAEQLDSEKTRFVGKTSALDFELLQAIDPSLHLISENYEDRLFDKFNELDFNFISMGAHLEEDPRGRMEWLKLVASLFDKEDIANTYYEEQLDRIDEVVAEVESSDEEKPNVAIVYFSASKKLFNVTKAIGHQAKMTELAGGIPYPIYSEENAQKGNSMTNEEFYKAMEEVDMIIYDNITGHLIQNKSDLLEHAPFVEDLKVVEEGNIIGLQRDYWQAADRVAELIEDLHEFIVTPKGGLEENRYYFLMK